MMKLSQVFELLTQGELSQVAIGGSDVGQITEDNYRAVGNNVKLGLTALYSRFSLKQNQLTLQLMQDIFTYPLLSRYAVNGKNSIEPNRWILDTISAPFGDDIIKIQSVIGDSGFEFSLNDAGDDFTMVTPTMETLRVPVDVVNPPLNLRDEYKTKQLLVSYQANHPNFMPKAGFFDPELVTIELPDSHVQALLYFVASRAHNPSSMSQQFNAGSGWAARYEAECQRLENIGAQIDDLVQADRIRRNGWV